MHGFKNATQTLLEHDPCLSIPALYWIIFVISTCMGCLTTTHMLAPGGGAPDSVMSQIGGRIPPKWDPSMEMTYPFRTWCDDIALWTCLTDLLPHQQCAAVILRLSGGARDLASHLTHDY